MDVKKKFEDVLGKTVNMALATSVEAQPNVRVVTYGYDPSKPGRLYFTTFKGNGKTIEFEKNAQVACMPLPESAEPIPQVRIFGRVEKSGRSMADILAMIENKAPGDAATIKQGGDMLEVYEVQFEKAFITLGMADAQPVVF